MKFWEFLTILIVTFANLFIFHRIPLYSSWYKQKIELIQIQNTTSFPTVNSHYRVLRTSIGSAAATAADTAGHAVSLRDTHAHYVVKPTPCQN